MQFRWALLLMLGMGCDGLIGEPSIAGDGRGPDGPGAITPALCASAPIDVPPTGARLLDAPQYTNALRAILDDDSLSPALDDKMGELITSLGAERLHSEIESIAQSHALGGCSDDDCAKDWLHGVARRAFRRSLTDEEIALLDQVYDRDRAHPEFPASVREATETVTQVILQAPQTLYLHEDGEPIGDDGVRRLRGHEIASRLALLLWNGIPDDALLDAAERGDLDEEHGIRSEAERMLADPRAREMVRTFFEGWLGLNGAENRSSLEEATKDAELFPEVDASLRDAMREEIGRFVERAIFDEAGTVEELLTARYAWVDPALAELYGVEASEPGWVELPASERSGLLTRAGFLSVYAGAKVRSPIRRGVFILQNVLCQPLGEPPPNANDVSVEGGDTDEGVRSIREDVTARTRGGECAACHDTINEVGFSFGHYDAIGRFRTEELHDVDGVEHVFDVDASGNLGSGSDVDGAVADARELSARLAGSAQVADCLATRFYEHAVGRHVTEADLCSVEGVKTRFRESGRFVDLIVALTESDAFRHVRPASSTMEDEE